MARQDWPQPLASNCRARAPRQHAVQQRAVEDDEPVRARRGEPAARRHRAVDRLVGHERRAAALGARSARPRVTSSRARAPILQSATPSFEGRRRRYFSLLRGDYPPILQSVTPSRQGRRRHLGREERDRRDDRVARPPDARARHRVEMRLMAVAVRPRVRPPLDEARAPHARDCRRGDAPQMLRRARRWDVASQSYSGGPRRPHTP